MASGEISIDTHEEGKSINTAVSPALIYTSSVWGRHKEAVYSWIFHTCATISAFTQVHACMYAAGIVDKYMCSTTCAYVYFDLIGQFNWVWKT